MSSLLYCVIEYEAAYAVEDVLALVEAVNRATLENWDRYRDRWTESEPLLLPVGRWAEAVESGFLDEYRFLGERRPKPARYKDHFFSYSPVSYLGAEFTPYEDLKAEREGRLGVHLFLSIGARSESEGNVPLERMRREIDENPDLLDDDEWVERLEYLNNLDTLEHSVWPENRACLLHVAERLREALPVEAVRMAPEFRDPDPP